MKNFLLLLLFASILSVQAAQPRVNGVEVIQSSNGTATNTAITNGTISGIINGVVNVRHSTYGTLADLSDDSAHIQAAATAAVNKTLYFPSGTYSFKSVTLPDGCTVVVDAGTIFTGASPSGLSFWFSASGKTNITIRGVIANGGGSMSGLISLLGCSNIKIYDATVLNCKTNTSSGGAGALVDAVNCSNITVDNSYSDGSGYGVSTDNSPRTRIVNTTIRNVYRDGILFYNRSDDSSAENNLIDGFCSGSQNGRGGIQAYGVLNPVIVNNRVLNAFPSSPADTGGIRFRDAANFVGNGNVTTNTSTGILCNQAGDFAGISTYGTINGNSINTSVYSGINVAGNGGPVIISGNYVANANTAASAAVPSISIASPYAVVNANIVTNNSTYGIYLGATGSVANGNKFLNVGNGGSSVPQLALAGVNVSANGNSFTDDRGTSVGYLGIRLYAGSTAQVGDQMYGVGITNFIFNQGTWKNASAPYRNEFSGAPSTGTFDAGSRAVDLNGKIYVCTFSGTPGTWRELLNSGSITISDAVYSSAWNGDTNATTKNAIYDKIEALAAAAAGTNSILVNGTIVQNPNFVDSTLTYFETASVTNISVVPTNIVNSQISTSAAIARSKVAAGTAAHVVINDGSGNLSSEATLGAARFPALTGDVTTPGGSLATTIANDAVTYAKMQNVSAASKLVGRGDSGSGDPQEITLGSGLTMTGTTLSASGGGAGIVGTVLQDNGSVLDFYPVIFEGTAGTNIQQAIYGYPYDGNPSIPANGTNWNQKGFVYLDGSNIGYGDGAAINTATIASDTISWPAQRRVTLQSESGTADNLSTIDYTGISSSRLGAYLYLQPKSGHTITIKHGTGNLFTSTAADVVLDRTYKYVIVTYDPAASSPNLMVFVPALADYAPKASPTFTGTLTIPTSAAPSTTVFGQLMGDNNAWAASHGTLQYFDGTANVYAIAAQASDTPSAGQVPKFNSDGTITWELDNGTADNWLSSGSTNSTLSGNAAIYSLTITNGLTVQGGSSQGTIMLYDSAGSPGGKGVRLSAPATQSTNINFILPDRPSIGGSGGQGIPILTVAAVTNVTMSITNTLAGLETALGSVNIIDQTEIDTSAELNTIITDNTGSGALVFGTGPTLTDAIASSSFQIPNGAAPTTDAFGEIAGDNNAWAVNRGAAQFFDGTANTYLIGALVSDIPSNGQVPKFNSATGTITWENDDGSSASISDTAFAASWDAVTTVAPSKNAVYDALHLFDKDDDGKVDTLDIASSIVKTDSLGGVTNAVAETDYVTPTGSGTLSNKTIDSANNVIKSKGYIKLAQPRNIDGTGCTYPNTNDFTASTFMLPLFDGTSGTNSNWARFSFRVPMDWDSSVDPVANITLMLAADDTSAATINLGVKSTALSGNANPTVSNWINFPQGSDTLGVNGDAEPSNGLTLTGWGALLTAGQWCTIQLNRDGSGDTSNQGRYLLELEIEYGKTQ